MARFKLVDYHQDLLLSVTLAKQLVPGSFEWAVHELIEGGRINLSAFDEHYNNDATGRLAYDPRILLKIVLVSYARGVLSSRKMERLCRENVTFMALTCGSEPDHSTLAAFITRMGDVAQTLFTNILLICEQEGLLAGTHLSIDGTKLSANASKEWSGKHADLAQKRDNIRTIIDDHIKQHQACDQAEEGDDHLKSEQRLTRLQKSADKIDAFLEQSQPRIGSGGTEIQSNITDPESAKMSTSHGVIQGYNANAVVDDKHQVIVAGEAFGSGTDHATLPSLLEQTEDNLAQAGHSSDIADITITADTSYFSQTNMQACAKHKVDAFIPDPRFRQRDPQLHEAKRFRRPTLLKPDKPTLKQTPNKPTLFKPKDFIHEPEHNRLLCPAGNYLYSSGSGSVHKGRRIHTFQGPKSACQNCKLRHQCLRKPDKTPTRQVRLFGEHVAVADTKKPTLAQRMREKIDTLRGRKTYRKRIAIVEPVFANRCTHKGMRTFTLRTQAKVNAQWLVYCMVHNIGKIARYGGLTTT